MQKEWVVSKNDNANKPLIERLLAIRGITGKANIKDFLNPLEMKLTEPTVFCDMKKSIERIVKAIDEKQKIVIYGDFDADGITSTSILYKTFKFLGAEFDYYIPDRENEGHGMNTSTLVKLMTAKKPKLLITVDCGISNFEEVKFLNSFGLDVIITDHHEASENLPPAFAIINPKAQNSLDEKLSARKIQELTSLAGCGVAFKLVQELLKHYEKTEFILELLPLVAVGTVADIVPLIGENRYFVVKGLSLIAQGQNFGLKRLLESANIDVETITSETISFYIAPRINATGRLDNVDVALKLLISDNKHEIEIAIQTLNELNKIRQNLCENTFIEAEKQYLSGNTDDSSIVLFNKDWNIGIIGIVASKFVEKYYKPTFIMTFNKEKNLYNCSARSIEGVNLYEALDINAELFEGFGGHEMAAGLSFSPDKVSFEEVKKCINTTIEEMLAGRVLKPIINVDLELQEKDLDLSLVDEIAKLEPFGASNPSPLFLVKDFTLKEKFLMGENKNHLRLKVQLNNNIYTCVWWGIGDISLIAGDKLDIVFSPKINKFRDNITLQLMIANIHSDNLHEEISENTHEIKVFDHRNKTDIFSQVEDYVMTSKMNILVFAENQAVVGKLKPYKSLYERVVTRKTLKKADSIMFFDYPPTEESFDEIIKVVSPRHIHYMACDCANFNEQSLLKTFSGMMKFACNNKDGEVEINRCATFLGLTDEIIISLLSVFNQCEMIKILEENKNVCKIEFLKNIELSQVLKCIQYADFKEKLDEIEEFKNYIMKKNID